MLVLIAAMTLTGCGSDSPKPVTANEIPRDAVPAGKSRSVERIDPLPTPPTGKREPKDPTSAADKTEAAKPKSTPEPAKEHPFARPIRRAQQVKDRLEKIKDYTAIMCKRELIGERLGVHQYMAVKIRHKPLSAYLKFLAPDDVKGREVIYVEGKNDGKLIAHPGPDEQVLPGLLNRLTKRTSRLDPKDPVFAMRGNRYPITEVGILNLMRRLIEVGRRDMQHGEATVRYFNDAKINGRPAPAMELVHPVKRDHFRFHVARVFIDAKLQVPTRYAAYKWPTRPGGPPVLMEEYTYLKIKLDVGLTDQDFDPTNPAYDFPPEK